MKVKSISQWMLKAACAGVIALFMASGICVLYNNTTTNTPNESGVTDYVKPANTFTSKMDEGIAWGVTDDNGFYNTSVVDFEMDVLVMGSSHMEGANVFTEQTTASVLESITGLSVYNIGTSGHTLLHCVKNLPTALSVMQPAQYVVIETATTTFETNKIEDCLSGEMADLPASNRSGPIINAIKEIKYLRLFNSQIQLWKSSGGGYTGLSKC